MDILSQSYSQLFRKGWIYLLFDLGVYKLDWVPSGVENNWTLPSLLSSLQAHKSDITMLRRVRNYYGDSNGEGPGDHAWSIRTFLTCAHSRYGSGQPSADFALPADTSAHPSFSGEKTTAGFANYHFAAALEILRFSDLRGQS